MSEKQRTPGPWLVKELLPPAGEPEQCRYVILWDDEKRSLKRRVDDHKGRFTEADSRLIAAAPDLLRVAEMVLSTATVETPKELIDAAEAAVNKALNK